MHLVKFGKYSRIQVMENGENAKPLMPNTQINFLQPYDALAKQVAQRIRLHKDEPLYTVEKMYLKIQRPGIETVLITQDLLGQLEMGEVEPAVHTTDRFMLTVRTTANESQISVVSKCLFADYESQYHKYECFYINT
jgi:hypothetical protein